MTGKALFSCFVAFLVIISTFGKSIKNNDQIVEFNIKDNLPAGMSMSSYTKSVRDYWTPERMASAKPRDVLLLDANQLANAAKRMSTPMKSQHTSRRVDIPGKLPKSLKAAPSVIGKVYGTIGTSNFVCSGSVIASENGDTLFTAGHCVYDTDTQSWVSNFMFVPAYDSGDSPYGDWVFRNIAILRCWAETADFNCDAAVVLVATSDAGEHIQDLTGSLGMTVNREREAHTDSYGYPVNIHRGEILASCSDDATAANIPQLPSFIGVRLPCNMTGGCSGGPWTQEGTYQTSVNSFGIRGQDDILYGPYFGDDILSLWDEYQRQ